MQDISGNVYNDLTVISFHHFDKKRNSYWLCQCSCGKQKIVRKSHLISGGVSSCGCKKAIKCGNASRKHGAWAKNKRLYKIWSCMVGRGTGKRRREYYFDRGITVCDEWKDVNNFFEWAIANGYQENLEIDRIDNNKGYSPENCRWANADVQNRNKSNNINITRNGETKCLKDWCKELGLKYRTICKRIASGWDTEKALTTPKIVGRPKNK